MLSLGAGALALGLGHEPPPVLAAGCIHSLPEELLLKIFEQGLSLRER